MRLKLALHRQGDVVDDVVVTVDATVSVGHLAREIQRADPRPSRTSPRGDLTLAVLSAGQWRTLPLDLSVAEAGLRSGASVAVTAGSRRFVDSGAAVVAATLRVLTGPDTGSEYPLRHGSNMIGRDHDCDVRLRDPLVSKRHARINVTDVVEVIDQNSANGVIVGTDPVTRYVLTPESRVILGDSEIAVLLDPAAQASVGSGSGGAVVAFNRAPRLDPRFEGLKLTGPKPPEPPRPQPFPMIALAAPVLMGLVLFLITRSMMSIVFVALSPVMMVGLALENRVSGRREHRRHTAAFRTAVADLENQLAESYQAERAGRCHEHPSAGEVAEAVRSRGPLLWTRRPEHPSFAQLRLGLGRLPSRTVVELPEGERADLALWRELAVVAERYAEVEDVPVVADLRDAGALGVAGAGEGRLEVVRALLLQLAGLHSPAELLLAAAVPPTAVPTWNWLSWLPHAQPDRSPLGPTHLAASPGSCSRVVAGLEGLVEERTRARNEAAGNAAPALPLVVLLVDDGAPVERGRLVALAESGPKAGVHVLWTAGTVSRLPASCRTFLTLDPNTGLGDASYVTPGQEVREVTVERIDADSALTLARELAPVVDAGAAGDQEGDLPSSVSLLDLAGREIAESVESIHDRWRLSNSLPQAGLPARRLRRDNTLRALIGHAAGAPLHIDLREQGPHALVGGTTGSGKSELLQSWILGMASAHSPNVTTIVTGN